MRWFLILAMIAATGCVARRARVAPPNLNYRLASCRAVDYTYVCRNAPPSTAYAQNSCWWVFGPKSPISYIDIDGLGRRSLTRHNGNPVAKGDLPAKLPTLVCFDGSKFIIPSTAEQSSFGTEGFGGETK